MSAQQPLFDSSRTQPLPCAVPGCQAIRLPDQQRVPTCAWDLERDGRRPRGCLNRVDNAHTAWPKGY